MYEVFFRVALFSFKSTIRVCLEYCGLALAGAPEYWLDTFDKLQKWVGLFALHQLLVLNSRLIVEM